MELIEDASRNVSIAYFSWSDIEKLCIELSDRIKESDFSPDIIVGIQRGGCMPALCLSHLLDIPDICTIGVRTTLSNDIRSSRKVPVIGDDYSLQLVQDKIVLLVDDVTNTGETLIAAKERVLKFGCKSVKTGVIIWDTYSTEQPCQADYYSISVDAWIVFPWEIEGMQRK